MSAFEEIKKKLSPHGHLPKTKEELRDWIAGKAGQWINQQSHVDREEAIDKALDVVNLIVTDWMLEFCITEGEFHRDITEQFADSVFQILAFHYQNVDPKNLGYSTLSRQIVLDE